MKSDWQSDDVVLLGTLVLWHDGGMVDFELFVKTLGPHAKHYTPEQLRQLHVEVRKLAEVLLAVHEAKAAARKKRSFPQPILDETRTDRTMTKRITEHAGDGTPTDVHIS